MPSNHPLSLEMSLKGKPLAILLPQADSTNRFLREWLEEDKSLGSKTEGEGRVVVANYQTAGRGRLTGRTWISPPGKGLTFSVAVALTSEAWKGRVSFLPILVGVALAETIEKITPVKLKWPNDLYAAGRKLCGTLIEGLGEVAVVGVGVNVNTEPGDFSSELREKATSLKILTGREWDRFQILEDFLTGFQSILDRWKKEPGETQEWVLAEYRRRDFLVEKRVRLLVGRSEERPEEVTVQGISNEGALRVKRDNGTLEEVYSGEITF